METVTVNLTGLDGRIIGRLTLDADIASDIGAAALVGFCPVIAPVVDLSGKMHEAALLSGPPSKPASQKTEDERNEYPPELDQDILNFEAE